MSVNSTPKRVWTRRAAALGGAALAGGLGYAALRQPQRSFRHAAIPAGLLRRGNSAEPGSLDPSLISTDAENPIVADLMVGLMDYDSAARPVPGMALSWTTEPDGLSWTFHLREAQWSDGVPVTADDFLFAWQRLLDPKTAAPYAYFIFAFRNAEKIAAGKLPPSALGVLVPDARTLVIELNHPVPYLLYMLGHMSMYPVPRHVVQAKGKEWIKPGSHVGNGPFTLKEWVPHEHILLAKNPRFYDAANVKLERVLYYPTDDYGAALQLFRAVEIDTQTRVASEQIDWIQAHLPETRIAVPQLSVEMIAVNHQRKPFDDIRVRRALNLAYNREVIANKVRRVGDQPAYNLVPPGIANFPGSNLFDFKSLSQAARVAQAQRLMRLAGFGPGRRLRTTFMIRNTSPGIYRAVAAAIQQMYAVIYVDITIIPSDFAIFIATTDAHNFDIAELAWAADFDDAETFLSLFVTGSGNNWGAYSNPAFDALLARSQQETDLEKRGLILAQAETFLMKDEAIIPMFFWANPGMQRPYVKGWVPNKMEYNHSRWVWIDEAARAATIVS